MKKYAIMILKDLTFKRFDHKDDMQTAVNALNKADKPHLVFIWQPENKTYYLPEQY